MAYFEGEKPMRWIRIRKANIDAGLRETFERYGTVGMQVALATTNWIWHQRSSLKLNEVSISEPLLSWLTQQHDREERKETWHITMEAAITVFVLVELVVSIISLVRCLRS